MRKVFTLALLTIFVLAGISFGNAANAETLDILAHAVFRDVMVEGEVDVVSEWIEDHQIVEDAEWRTYSISPLHDTLFREATLPETEVDVSFLLNTHATPRIEGLLTPLDDFLEEDPIPGFPEEFPPGMIESLTFNDQLYGIPVRSATSMLHYNSKLFEERGLEGPPETIDEFIDYARELTFTREDGEKVYGFVHPGVHLYANVVDFMRAWDADIITEDYEVTVNEPEAIEALEALNEMYEEGLIPEDLPVLDSPDVNVEMQEGRAAMTMATAGRTETYNDPEYSEYANYFEVASLPIHHSIEDEYEMAPAKTEFWALTIPQNAQNKELSWDFIRYAASLDTNVNMALSGNIPARLDVFEQEAFIAEVPHADLLGEIVEISRVPLPAFEEFPEAEDQINDYLLEMITGERDVEEATTELAEILEDMMP